ncbi:transmembrane efflux protein [Pyrenophora tritici-repentis]|nr:transmembrane efflux protein [Pyrenophora tritici-repentis]KAF7453660.1 transmembrane efflux protein [Pyrenophora tritici-repentis]
MSPMMNPSDPAALQIPRAFAFLAGSVKCRAICACAEGMVNAAPIPWNALATTSPMKVEDKAQTKLNRAKKTVPNSKTRRCLECTLAEFAKSGNSDKVLPKYVTSATT